MIAPSNPSRETDSDLAAAPASRRQALFEIALIFTVFLVQAGLQVPGVNEPYYLGKAKHYWNPQWCERDPFLNSADAHAVFYWLCGWWTLLMPLSAVAVVGRVLTYGLLAVAWRRLSTALVPGAWWSVLSAALLVTLAAPLILGGQSQNTMAGEWIVGGFEAKGLAFAAVFLALEAMVRNRWTRAWVLFGLATSLHVLIGGWAAVAAAIAWLSSARDPARPSFRRMLVGIGLGALIAMPGLWMALAIDRGATPAVAAEAAQIQVFERLGHHLDPGHFFFQEAMPTEPALRFIAMTVLWAGLGALVAANAGARRWRRFVWSTLSIAMAGMLIYLVAVLLLSKMAMAASLLRFYWFRLADAMVPAAAALAIIAYLSAARKLRPVLATASLAAALALAGVHLAWESYDQATDRIPLADRRFSPDEDRYADWLEICSFAATQTPPRALFLTPAGSSTFKWYAGRAEVANWKEMPQDAASIVAWWKRLQRIQDAEGGSGPVTRLQLGRLAWLGGAYRAQYLIVRTAPAMDLPRQYLFRNRSFALYRIGQRR